MLGSVGQWLVAALAVAPALITAAPVKATDVTVLPFGTKGPYYYGNQKLEARSIINVDVERIRRDLGAMLSPGTLIYGPGSMKFDELTLRWRTTAPPKIDIVIQPAAESDIAKIVRYSNLFGFDFLVVNRGHGFTTSLGKFQGIQIDVKQLRKISIAADGKTAVMQGGVYASDMMKYLWDRGYYTVSGSNECVGLMGPALGGGHGRLQGEYGLVMDQLVSMNVVLADGREVVVSKNSNADLWWAMRGAGHNFGIVKSFTINIYKKANKTWHWRNYYWSIEQHDRVFAELNKKQDHGNNPARMGATYLQINFNPSVNATHPTMWWTASYNGPSSEIDDYFKGFEAIPAIRKERGDAEMPDLMTPQDTGEASCGGGNFAVSTAFLQTYNISTQRALLDLFMERAAKYPEISQWARLYHQGYGVKGTQSVDPASSSYAHRDEVHLAFFLTAIPPGTSQALVDAAYKWAKDSWDLWVAGQAPRPMNTYVNYATGAPWETLESVYGRNLPRLRLLKAKYDPMNKFRFYVPINPPK